MAINLNEGIPLGPIHKLVMDSNDTETKLVELYIGIINIVRDRNYVAKDARSNPGSYEKISLEISNSRRTIANAISKARKTSNLDTLRKIVFKLLKAGI